jgi:hypothetical protein
MILTLASATVAALIPSNRLLANPDFRLPAHHSCDQKLADTIAALEHASWQAGMNFDVHAADALYANEFVEVLQDGSLYTKEQLLQDLRDHAYVITNFEMTEISVVRLSASSALIRYRITAGFDFGDGVVWTFDLRVTSTYGKVRGQWKAFSYQETNVLPPSPE